MPLLPSIRAASTAVIAAAPDTPRRSTLGRGRKPTSRPAKPARRCETGDMEAASWR